MSRFVDHSRPEHFRPAADHSFGVLRDFVWAKRRMKSSHDDRDVAFAIFSSDLVCAFGGIGFDTDGDEVRRFIKWNLLHAIIVKLNLDSLGSQTRERRCRKWLHLPRANIFL